MPSIGAMAFTPDGSALWTVSRGLIEVRSWPSLDPVTSVAVGAGGGGLHSLAFHPAGRLAALALGTKVWMLGGDARPLDGGERSVDLALAVAFDEQGRLLVAHQGGVSAVLPSGGTTLLGVPPPGQAIPNWIWRAAILPAAHRVIYCVNDGRAVVYGWDDGRVLQEEAWDQGVFTPGGGDRTSWLAADVAPGERAFVCGRKSGRTWAVKLRAGVPESALEVQKAAVRRPEGLKRPMRTTAHAIHPTEDALVYAEISGYAGHARLSTGELVRELPRHSGGYAWE